MCYKLILLKIWRFYEKRKHFFFYLSMKQSSFNRQMEAHKKLSVESNMTLQNEKIKNKEREKEIWEIDHKV